ncbi:MAG: mechanosensitive ion channel family protein [Simkaniaceae bacterium]
MEQLEAVTNQFGTYAWAFKVFLIIFFALLTNFIASRVFRRILPNLKKHHKIWEEALVAALYKPFKILIWLLAFAFIVDILGDITNEETLIKAVPSIRIIGGVIVLVWFLASFTKGVEDNLLSLQRRDKNRLDETTVRAIGKLLRVSVIITSIVIALQAIGIPVSGVVAFGGIGGIAVGFAAKDLLANFFGGLMVFLDRPFSIGDWIRSPDREMEGTVEHIGWRTTRIRTFDKRPLFVPNSLFSTISIENPSRMSNRRIKTNIGVRYCDALKIKVIMDEVKEMLANHPEIAQDKITIVNLIEFGPSSLIFMLYTFTKTTNWLRFQEIQQDVFLKVMDIITMQGAECAFPTSTLHIPDGISLKNSN